MPRSLVQPVIVYVLVRFHRCNYDCKNFGELCSPKVLPCRSATGGTQCPKFKVGFTHLEFFKNIFGESVCDRTDDISEIVGVYGSEKQAKTRQEQLPRCVTQIIEKVLNE